MKTACSYTVYLRAQRELNASPRKPNVFTPSSRSEKSAIFEVWCLSVSAWKLSSVTPHPLSTTSTSSEPCSRSRTSGEIGWGSVSSESLRCREWLECHSSCIVREHWDRSYSICSHKRDWYLYTHHVIHWVRVGVPFWGIPQHLCCWNPVKNFHAITSVRKLQADH